jgi:hypothetical protein
MCVVGGERFDEVRVLEGVEWGDKRSSRGGMDACSSWAEVCKEGGKSYI